MSAPPEDALPPEASTAEASAEPDAAATAEPAVEAPAELEVEAPAELEAEATAELEAEATAELEVEATAEPEAEAPAELEVEATAELEVEATAELEAEEFAEESPEESAAPAPAPALSRDRPPARASLFREARGYRLRLDPADLARLRELPGSRGRTDEDLGEEFLAGQADRFAASLADDVAAPEEIRVVVDPWSRQAFLAVGRTIRAIVSF